MLHSPILLGVLMWEVFSEGKIPYENRSNSEVVEDISSGFRLYKPRLASLHIYQLMNHCWKEVSKGSVCPETSFNLQFQGLPPLLVKGTLLEDEAEGTDKIDPQECAFESLTRKGSPVPERAGNDLKYHLICCTMSQAISISLERKRE